VDLVGLIFLYCYPHDVFGWHYQYLTIWGLTTQTIYFGFAFLVDLVHIHREIDLDYKHVSPAHNYTEDELRALLYDSPPQARRSRLETHKDRLFTLCFPLGTLIGVFFWTLVWTDPTHDGVQEQLINSPGGFPLVFQQHGTTLIFVWVELFMTQHFFGKKRWEALIVALYAAIYIVWNVIIHAVTGDWVYPFQGPLAANLAIGIPVYAGMILLASGVYLLGRVMNHFWWRFRWNRFKKNHPLHQSSYLFAPLDQN
jgi:hypothetical protein